jgi:hypothetical protein
MIVFCHKSFSFCLVEQSETTLRLGLENYALLGDAILIGNGLMNRNATLIENAIHSA